MTAVKILKAARTPDGEPWYNDARINRLAQINGGRLYGERTMVEMLEDGSLLDDWTVPDEEIFGTTPEYLAQFDKEVA